MNNNYWKEKYADYHSRSESKIAELNAENEKLKEKLHELKCPFYFKHTAICLGRRDEMQKYEKCSYYANCNIKQMAKLIEKYKTCLQEIKTIAKENLIGCFADKCDLACEILDLIIKEEK